MMTFQKILFVCFIIVPVSIYRIEIENFQFFFYFVFKFLISKSI